MKVLRSLDPSVGLLILRLSGGGLMLTHGYQKLTMLMAGGEIRFFDFLGIGSTASLVLAVAAEFLCSILLILGVRTRMVSIPLIVTMVVAAFMVHGADPLAKKEMALLYLAIFTSLFFSGGGKLVLVKD